MDWNVFQSPADFAFCDSLPLPLRNCLLPTTTSRICDDGSPTLPSSPEIQKLLGGMRMSFHIDISVSLSSLLSDLKVFKFHLICAGRPSPENKAQTREGTYSALSRLSFKLHPISAPLHQQVGEADTSNTSRLLLLRYASCSTSTSTCTALFHT